MLEQNVIENLGALATKAELTATILELQQWHPSKGNITPWASEVLRDRAKRYRAAQDETLFVEARQVAILPALPTQPAVNLAWTARAALAGSLGTLLILVATNWR